MHLNQIIRTKRLAAGLTQEALAQKVGVTSPAVSKWEKGISYPDITVAADSRTQSQHGCEYVVGLFG